MKPDRQTLAFNDVVELATPYQKARQHWDDRIGSARVQARNWRLMAFGCLGVTLILLGLVAWQIQRSELIPYVVEVAEQGSVRSVGPALNSYMPNDRQIAYHLSAFVTNIRSLSADPVVVRKNWLHAYHYVTSAAAVTLSEHARKQDPFSKVGTRTISVDILSVVRASKKTFQVRWAERSYVNGSAEHRKVFTGLFTIALRATATEEALKNNPLGIYIEALNWSQESEPKLKSETASEGGR
ncbi:MAG: conjugal transfer protein TrbF [Methyloligellaceae bacterium]